MSRLFSCSVLSVHITACISVRENDAHEPKEWESTVNWTCAALCKGRDKKQNNEEFLIHPFHFGNKIKEFITPKSGEDFENIPRMCLKMLLVWTAKSLHRDWLPPQSSIFQCGLVFYLYPCKCTNVNIKASCSAQAAMLLRHTLSIW